MEFSSLLSRMFYKMYVVCAPRSPKLFSAGSDDIYLVSYPRSGNTWMRVMISELLYGESGESIEDLQYYVPDIHVKTYANEVIPSSFHVVKSHFPYNKARQMSNYKRVVYLIRDPSDAVLSCYRYQAGLGRYDSVFERFLPDWLNGRIWPCSWQEHVNSWTGVGAVDLGVDLFVIRYEDLITNTEDQIGKLVSFLELNVTQEVVRRAVASASVHEMRLREKRGMRPEERAEGFQFIGPATCNQWQGRLTSEQLDLIISYARAPMERHGYL